LEDRALNAKRGNDRASIELARQVPRLDPRRRHRVARREAHAPAALGTKLKYAGRHPIEAMEVLSARDDVEAARNEMKLRIRAIEIALRAEEGPHGARPVGERAVALGQPSRDRAHLR